MGSLSPTTLQLCFGLFGIVSVIVALAALNYRDSWGCVIFQWARRQREPDTVCMFLLMVIDEPARTDHILDHELPTIPPAPETTQRIEPDLEPGIISEPLPPAQFISTAVFGTTPSTTASTPVEPRRTPSTYPD
jgi:hypothetical protein